MVIPFTKKWIKRKADNDWKELYKNSIVVVPGLGEVKTVKWTRGSPWGVEELIVKKGNKEYDITLDDITAIRRKKNKIKKVI
jgi:hypothetical protein